MPDYSMTVAELISRLDIPVVVSTAAGLEKPVSGVKIVTTREAVKVLPPRTALVVAGDVASSGWSVDLVIRAAWERAAACVILPHSDVHANSTAALAQSLGIVLLAITSDPLDFAVQAAMIISSPDATAATIVAAVAELSTPAASPARTVKGLGRVLPGYDFSVTDEWGQVVATTALAASSRSTPNGPQTAAVSDVSVKVPFPRSDSMATIHAISRHSYESLRQTEIRHVLRIAAAPLTSWAALRRLRDQEQEHHAAELLERFLEGSEKDHDVLAEIAALGWSSAGPHFVVVVPVEEGRRQRLRQSTLLRERWLTSREASPFVESGSAFVQWIAAEHAGKELDPEQLLQDTAMSVKALASDYVKSAGIVGPIQNLRELSAAIEKGLLAARIAAETGQAALDSNAISKRGVLPILVASDTLAVARATLERLAAIDHDGELVRTLLVALDNGEHIAKIARVLKLHRNTVAARLERIRSLGIDTADPDRRLAIHVAANLLVNSSDTSGRRRPS
ncbi:PucR family transcriptional regulator [Arthrobacter cryoconiti]|uniref:PucR family transcriptional regulator n=1 Tax=Arthrobacter cryoconiti TaxID=748907 RepID=A0ABV8R2W4_9MICC|nr:PucR family transcriptional regulator [Arthrobacter cryoconiti]MCC9068601.1 helix-turn-helix domain-containing protein [Arthrobacter cryoconiti]